MEVQVKSSNIIMRLFRRVWQLVGWIRTTLLNVLFLMLVVMVIAVFVSKETPPLTGKMALRIAPGGFLVDQRSLDPMTLLFEDKRPEEVETLVQDLIDALRHGATDDRISGVVLALDYLQGGGISKLEEVGQALTEFKRSGKPIVAVADSLTQDQYYLASYADDIYLHPLGHVWLTGYGVYRQYFKEGLDKLAVNFHVFRVGEYKDFIEPYTRNAMSAASREHNAHWLNNLWGRYANHIENRRHFSKGTLNRYINQLDQHLDKVKGNGAQLALDVQLVDHLADRQMQDKTLLERFGSRDDSDDKAYAALDYWNYLKHIKKEAVASQDKVGVIVAKGIIVYGESKATDGYVGSDDVVKLLRNARKNKRIKALVLRVDSGGGSAFASDVIRREIAVTRATGMPVVVSMGSVAASGGYLIAAGSDEIWATPATITGSIGVFGAFPTLENSLEKMGIYTDGLGTTELAGAMRIDRPLPTKVKNILQQSVNFIYQDFIQTVAKARGQSIEDIHNIAQGRVWSGAQALELGLVDKLGSLDDTVVSAAKRAGLTSYDVITVEKPLSTKEQFLVGLTNSASVWQGLQITSLLKTLVPVSMHSSVVPTIDILQDIHRMNDPQGFYAQCSLCLAP